MQGRIREDDCSLLVNVLVEGVVDFFPFSEKGLTADLRTYNKETTIR
jgi:hypothetical protein